MFITIMKNKSSITIPPGMDRIRELSVQEEKSVRENGTVADNAPSVVINTALFPFVSLVASNIPDRAVKLNAAP